MHSGVFECGPGSVKPLRDEPPLRDGFHGTGAKASIRARDSAAGGNRRCPRFMAGRTFCSSITPRSRGSTTAGTSGAGI